MPAKPQPKSQPIYVRIAEQLHSRRQGQRPATPPSVRKLARQFGVSPITASRALQFYRVQLAGQEAARAESEASPERWAVRLHVSPGPHQHAAAQLTADGFRALAIERQVSFDFDSLRIADDADAGGIRACVAAAVEAGAGGIFLLPSRVSDEALRIDERLLEACSAAGLPVVLLERNLRGEDRPLARDLVSFHDFEGGRLLTRHLVEQGRKRIAFLTGSPTSSHVERLAGYLSALRSAGLAEQLVIEQPPSTNPGAAYTDLAARLLEWEADSVICFHEYAALGVIMELLRRGRSVPDDTAVAAFYSLGLGESYSIGITAYAYPAQTVAARALDLMRWRLKSPDAPPCRMVVPGELILRNSTVAEAIPA